MCFSMAVGHQKHIGDNRAMNQPATAQLLPSTGFLRIRQIVGDRSKGILPLIPVSRSSWWQGIKEGKYPKGVLLGPRTRVWRAEEIRDLIASTSVPGVR
jgi:prophage regulatory protein